MAKFLKKLGIDVGTKVKKEEILEEVRKQAALKRDLEKDHNKLKSIVTNLGQKYESSKKKDFMNRYEVMKTMIKEAVDEYSKFKPAHRPGMPPGGGQGKPGALSRLRQTCQEFADTQHSEADDEERFASMSAKELEQEARQIRKENLEMKEEIRKTKEKLEQLSKEYEGSKQFNPAQRYEVLKDLIKAMYRPAS